MMSPSDRATTPIVLHPANDVAVVCQDTPAGTELRAAEVTISATAEIPSGQKAALRAISAGEAIHKCGQVIEQPFFMLLNVAVGGNLGGPIFADSVFPARMLVDYIRICQPEAA